MQIILLSFLHLICLCWGLSVNAKDPRWPVNGLVASQNAVYPFQRPGHERFVDLRETSSFNSSHISGHPRPRLRREVSQRHWYEAPRILPMDLFTIESYSYANESKVYRCHAKGMPNPTVVWYVRYNNALNFSRVPEITDTRLGVSQRDGELRFSSLTSSSSASSSSSSSSSSNSPGAASDSSALSTAARQFQLYCQASNILGVARSRILQIDRVPPPKNLKISYSTNEIAAGMRALITCALSSDGTYFTVDHWELRMAGQSGDPEKVLRSNSKYRFISVAPHHELQILKVTQEEIDNLHVRCVFRSIVNRQLLTEVQHVVPNPALGFKLIGRSSPSAVTPFMPNFFKRLTVTQGTTMEFPCYHVRLQGAVDWSFSPRGSGQSVKKKIDFSQKPSKYTLVPDEPGGNLIIHQIDLSDAGSYNCRSEGPHTTTEALVLLEVTVPLNVILEPSHKLATLGESIELKCQVTGYPYGPLQWLYNGELLQQTSNFVTLAQFDLGEGRVAQKLVIPRMTVNHIGVYQCLILDNPNDQYHFDNAQATSTILMEKLDPQLREQTPAIADPRDAYKVAQVRLSLNPQVAPSNVNLMCQFFGHPVPTIRWFLDENIVTFEDLMTMPQIEDPTPSQGEALVTALAYVKETKLRIDLNKVSNPADLWKLGGEYKAVATSGASPNEKTAECRFIVMVDTKLTLRPLAAQSGASSSSSVTCTAGSLCTLMCHPIAATPVKLEWSRSDGISEEKKRVPEDHRQEVVDNGRKLIIREVEEDHKGVYHCEATAGNERKNTSIELKVAYAPKVSDFPRVIPVTEGESTVTQLCSSKVLAGKPWFAWWEYRPFENMANVRYFCNQMDTPSMAITYGSALGSSGVIQREPWMDVRPMPCLSQSSNWFEYANRVPTLNIRLLNRSEHHGKFTCVIGNAAGMDKLSMNVTFTPEYQFLKRPPNKLAITLGESVTVDCQAKSESHAPPVVEWRYVKNGGPYQPVPRIADLRVGHTGFGQYDNGTLNLWNVNEDIPRKYYCFLMPRPDSPPPRAKEKSTAVNVDVNIPAKIVPIKDRIEVRKGSSFNITCDVQGDPEGMTVTWYRLRRDAPSSNDLVALITWCEFDGKKNGLGTVAGNVAGGASGLEHRPASADNSGRDLMAHCLRSGSTSNAEVALKGEVEDRMRQYFSYKRNGKGIVSHLEMSDVNRQEQNAYQCHARNAYNKDGVPDVARVTLLVVAKPEPVKLHSNVLVEAKSVTLKWSKPTSDNGKIITHYKISYFTNDFRSLNNNTTQESAGVKLVNETTPSNSREVVVATVDSLRPFTNYTVSVVAVNEVGDSEAAMLNVTTKPAAPDGGVLKLRANGSSSDVIEVHWAPPALDRRNGIITGYELCYLRMTASSLSDTSSSSSSSSAGRNQQRQQSQDDSRLLEALDWDWTSTARGSNGQTTFTDLTVKSCVQVEGKTRYEIVGLPKFTEYAVRVSALNAMGTSPYEYTRARTMEDLPQEPPTNVKCNPEAHYITVKWSAPKPETINGVLTGYIITYFPSNELGDESLRKQDNVSKYLQHDVIGLKPYTNYTIRVQAQNSKGVGPSSPPLFCVTKEAKSTAVRSLKATALNETCIVVSWLPPEQPNGLIKNYCTFLKSPVQNLNRCSAPKLGMQQWNVICGLEQRRQYSVQVQPISTMNGDVSILNQTISSTSSPKEAIISIGYSLQIPANSDVFLDCLTVNHFKPMDVPRSDFWDPQRMHTLGNRREHLKNGTLRIERVLPGDSGEYYCNTQEDTVKYELTVTEVGDEPPSAPIWQHSTSNYHGIQVTWLSRGASRVDRPVTGFLLKWRNMNTDEPPQEVSLGDTARSFYVNPLACATAVEFRIRAHSMFSYGHWSEAVVFNTTGKAPILGNNGLTAHTRGQTWLYLNLSAAFLPGDGCAPEIYLIRLAAAKSGQPNVKQGQDWLINQTVSKGALLNHCCWNVTGLHTDAVYHYELSATNAAGSVSLTNMVATLANTSPASPLITLKNKDQPLDWFLKPTVLIPMLVVLFALVLLIVGLLLWFKRDWMEKQHNKPLMTTVHQTDMKNGPNSGGPNVGMAARHGNQYPRSTAADKPLPPKPVYMSQDSKVYSTGNSSDLPNIYPPHRHMSEDAHSVLSYNSEVDQGTLGGDIEPYAIYERNGLRMGGEFIPTTDPMTTSMTSASGGNGSGLMRQRSRRSGSGSGSGSGGPPAPQPHRQLSQPVQSIMTMSMHHPQLPNYHYPQANQYRGGQLQQQQPVMTGTMRPQRLGGGGLAAHRLDEETGCGTPTGRKSSSLDCLHKIGADVNEHHHHHMRGQPAAVGPSDFLRAPGPGVVTNGYPPSAYSQGIHPTPNMVSGQVAVATPNGNDGVYRGGTSTVSSNHDELAQAYEAGTYPMIPGSQPGGPVPLAQPRPALMPNSTTAALQHAHLPPNDSSGSSTDPGIREFTQQPPRPAETRQAVCHVAAAPMQRHPSTGRGHPQMSARGPHSYQRGVSDMSDATYDTIENTLYYQQQNAARPYVAGPAPNRGMSSGGTAARRPSQPQDYQQQQQRQPLLAANEEWADAAPSDVYNRGGPPQYNPNPRQMYGPSAAANFGRLPQQQQSVAGSQMEKRGLLAAGNSNSANVPGMNPQTAPSQQWLMAAPSVAVVSTPRQSSHPPPHPPPQQQQPSHEDEEEEDPYTDKFTMV